MIWIGWDRTPLYISLLRILLWAEGLVHQSLDVDQMLYLTVAYDWLLFGYVYITAHITALMSIILMTS